MNKKTVKVYDTFKGKVVDVKVSQEVYDEYMRTEWGIKNNNAAFYEHEIQFSMLIGGEDGAFENFHEFIVEDDPTAGCLNYLRHTCFVWVCRFCIRIENAPRCLNTEVR